MVSINFLLWSKKIICNMLVFMFVLNTSMLCSYNDINIESFEQTNVVSCDSIVKCYNAISLLPIKIVNNFLSLELIINNNTENKDQNKSKSQKKEKTKKQDFIYNFISDFNVSQICVKKVNSVVCYTNIKNNLVVVADVIKILISSYIVNKVLFNGNMILARGDTEYNIIKYQIAKRVRLI